MATRDKSKKKSDEKNAKDLAEQAIREAFEEEVFSNVAATVAVPVAASGERSMAGLFVIGPDAWLNEYVARVQDGLGLYELNASQTATLKRILSDENSLLRMWCEGRLDVWKEEVLAEKPPELVEGVLPSPDITLGADWELPFNHPVLENDPDSTHFDRFFFEQLEKYGFEIKAGEYRSEDAGDRVVFSYFDTVSALGTNEFGLPVIQDTREGWQTYSDFHAAFNAVNQGITETNLPTIMGLPEKACVDNLLAPVFMVNERTDTVQKKRLVSGAHLHFGLADVEDLEDITFSFSDVKGRALSLDVSECLVMAEEHVYRLGQHKQFGWRVSEMCHPYDIPPNVDLRDALQVNPNFNLRDRNDLKTIQFRPNDTYIETVDPKASFRRMQAQAAFYGGMLWTVAKEPREGYDYTILKEGQDVGLLTGWSKEGRGAGSRTEEGRKKLAELHFCAALDLFIDGGRTATTVDGEPFELRKLVFYEWATSTEPRKPAWALV